jgi:hypothetical protein
MLRQRSLLCLLVLFSGAGDSGARSSGESVLAASGPVFIRDGGDVEASRSLQAGRYDLPIPDLTSADLANPPVVPTAGSSTLAALMAEPQPQPPPRPMAFEYSDGYGRRAKVHKYASIATLPIFAAQFAVGQKLYNGHGSDGTRTAHSALAATTGGLFAVNTVTGTWNLYEGRRDPNHRKRRMVHGILMMVADAGFVATGALAPDEEGEGGVSRSTHRTIALTSMGIATVGYLIMLIGD